MRHSIIVLFISILCGNLCSQSTLNYSKLRIDLTQHDIGEIAALGFETDHGTHHPGKAFVNVFNSEEIKVLINAGIKFENLIPDLAAYYKLHGTTELFNTSNKNKNCSDIETVYDYETPVNYEYGSMGGYLTYQQVLDNLDKMKSQFPEFITERLTIGNIKTHQGRSLYYLVISNTPDNIDLNKPQIFYNALHHAREPNSISQLLFYMWYLLENYGSNDEVTYLVDNTTMFFMPMVNPDGYVYNQTTNPNGGGFWRKNRYPNENGDTVGVDLNRNYGFEWNFDNQGSSGNENSETYRGPSAYSEPETQAVRELCNANRFQIALNYHTFGDLLIHPWGYSDQPTEEDFTFKSLANIMTAENSYLVGTGSETVGYVVNGNSDDWMYGEELEKDKIYSMTPEVGPAFWPSESSIDQLNKSSLRHNLNSAHLLLNYGWVEELQALNTITDPEGNLYFELEKSGFQDGEIALRVISKTPGFVLTENVYENLLMSLGEKRTFEIKYELEPDFSETEILIEVQMDNGIYMHKTDILKLYDADATEPSIVIINELNDFDEFETEGTWGLSTSNFFTPPTSIGNAPQGDYLNNTMSELVFLQSFNVENLEMASIKYQTKFDIEPEYDFVQILMSVDGAEFVPLCGELTNQGSVFQVDEALYDGIMDWSLETICLDEFLPASELQFKFRFVSDAFVTGDGFYFDDLTFEGFGNGVGTSSYEVNSFLNISPNPSTDQIRISLAEQSFNAELSVEIYDLLGKKLIEQFIDKSEVFIDVSNLSVGSYNVKIVKNGNFISSGKFVKQ